MRTTLGGTSAVVAATALVSMALAIAPLYVSAAASEAVQVALGRTCGADAGLQLPVPYFLDAAILDELDAMAVGVEHVEAPVRTVISAGPVGYRAIGGDDDLTDAIVLVARDGQLDELGTPPAALGPTDALVPDSAPVRAGVTAGDRLLLDVEGTGGQAVPLDVAGRYPDVPILPEPSYWCGLRRLFRPNTLGDLPPMVVLVEPSFLDSLPETAVARGWELRPDASGMTRHDALRLLEQYRDISARFVPRLSAAYEAARDRGGVPFRLPDTAEPALERIVTQAETVSDVVGRTMAPIRLAGAAAGTALLAGAGVLVARERRRELRLRVLRGEGPARLAVRVGLASMVPAAAGAVLGTALAFAGIRAFGPTPELEPAPAREAVAAGALGALVAIVIVGAAVSAVATRSVDVPARNGSRTVPWELVPVLLAVAAFLRLDRVGGVRLVGDDAAGGDLLAQAFPLLALTALCALCLRPLAWVARRSRGVGDRLPAPAVIGLRRVGAEPVTSAAFAVVSALAIGVFVVSTSMTSSARQLLDDKAATYLGSDEIITVVEILDLPPGLTGTIVGRLPTRSAGLPVNVVGVDPATFTDVVELRRDASDEPLDTLLDALDDPGVAEPLPAIVVGGQLGSGTLTTYHGQDLSVRPVATARWFPGHHAGAVSVIVDRDALARTGLAFAEEVWLRHPPPDARDRLTAAGFTVRGSLRAGDVFDVISFLAVRWSYRALGAFGIAVAVVLLVAQLLVLDARRRARQAAFVLARPMGARGSTEYLAIVTELAIPFVAGALIAVPAAVVVLRIGVRRFDTLRQLPPPARVVLPIEAMLGAIGVGVAALGLVALIGAVSVARVRPMEVMRNVA